MQYKYKTEKTWWVKIYFAGDVEIAKQVCREECFRDGLCITIEPCEYIYTGGQESGYVIGLVNYPRFPASKKQLEKRALILAELLLKKTYQLSGLIVTPNDTHWIYVEGKK